MKYKLAFLVFIFILLGINFCVLGKSKKRPQEPSKPFPYNEEEVTYKNNKANVRLAGTFVFPRSKKPFPAVLLISGSGPQDRNEMVAGHKPFLVLSDYLVRRGIAVLRVDDRGFGKSTGNHDTATTQDFAEDVLYGIEYLKTRKEISHNQIGLIGHSEGGLIAPIAASNSSHVAFIVLLAGPGMMMKDILLHQIASISINDVNFSKGEGNLHRFDNICELVSSDIPLDSARSKSLILAENIYESLPPAEKVKTSMKKVRSLITKLICTPWMRFALRHDPRKPLKKVMCPVLAMNGAKDIQVPATLNLSIIATALKEGGNNKITTLKIENLNHLFQTCETGEMTEYSKIKETMSPVALKAIGDWILKITKKLNVTEQKDALDKK